MKVKIFDENHEKELERKINDFMEEPNIDVIDIKYQVAITMYDADQIYCFSALLMYREIEV